MDRYDSGQRVSDARYANKSADRWGSRRRGRLLLGLFVSGILLGACSSQEGLDGRGKTYAPSQVSSGNVSTYIPPGTYDSADTAAVVSRNEEEGTIILFHLPLNRTYTLTSRMAVSVTDAYGEPISLGQVEPGQIVDITFLKSQKRLNTLQISPKAWEIAGTDDYDLDWKKDGLKVGEKTYALSQKPLLLEGGAGGRRIEAAEIVPTDLVTIRGIGSKVYSILVEQGHGYLRLEGHEKFLGGWIEVGQDRIQRIGHDMKLTLPEGSYPVTISYKGGGGTREVVIERNQETSLDISDMEIPAPQKGKVTFLLKPSSARLFIDGEERNTTKALELEYGIYELVVKAENYLTTSRYLRVGESAATLEIELEQKESPDATQAATETQTEKSSRAQEVSQTQEGSQSPKSSQTQEGSQSSKSSQAQEASQGQD